MLSRVLVTGASGLLGGVVVQALRRAGHDVVTHGRVAGDVVGDLSDVHAAGAVLDSARPDVVVNLVALTDVDDCERAPQRAFLSNVRVVENIVAWLGSGSAGSHLVQISTDQVYDGTGGHNESDVTLTNHYAVSKYAGELAAARTSHTVLRTNFFGPSGTGSRASWSDWLIRSLTSGADVTVFEDVEFSPLSMTTLAEVIAYAVEHAPQGIFNAGASTGMSKADFAYALAGALGLPTKTMRRGTSADVSLLAYRPKGMVMDSSRLGRTCGIALPSLTDEISTVTAQYASHA